MNQNTLQDLINRLSHDLKPVKPLPHIAMVTAIWAMTLLGLGFSSAYLLDASPKAWHLPNAWPSILNWFFSICIGIWALAHTFQSQIPGYKFNRGLFTLVLTVWFIVNLSSLLTSTQPLEHLGHSTPCYFFVVATGVPMLILSIFFLKKYTFIDRLKTLKLLSLSTIFLSFSLLSLCHSPHMSINDFFMHLLGALTLTAFCFGLGYQYLIHKH